MKPVEILAVDFFSTLHILCSVAAAKEISQSTKYGWRTTDLIMSASWRGNFGMWEAEVPNGRQLKAAIQAATRERALHMVRVAGEGPVAVAVALYGMGVAVGSTMVAGAYTTKALVALPVVGLTKSVSFAVIKDWNRSQNAKAGSIVFEFDKAGVNEGSGKAGGNMAQGKGLIAAMATASDADIAIAHELQREAMKQSERKLAEAEARLGRLRHF